MADIKIIVDSSDVATASNRIDQLGKSSTVAEKGVGKAVRGVNQFGAVAKNGGKKMNTFNMQLQQGGYQLQDFVVQLQSGTSFFTAFAQQGSQFAGVFGPKGAVIGAVIAIGSAVAGVLVNSLMGASKEVDNLTEALGKYKSLSDKIADYNGLSEQFGNLAEEAMLVLEALKAIENINIKKQLAELGGIGKVLETSSMQVLGSGFLNLIPTFEKINVLSAKTVTDAQKFLGLSEGSVAEMAAYAGEYARALMDVQSGGTLEEQAASAGKLSEFLKKHVESRGEEVKNLEKITKLQEVLLGLIKATATASTALEAFGGEGPDLEAIAKARKKVEETISNIRRANAVAFFKDEQAVQEDIHQVWVKNNAAENTKRLADIKTAKKGRMSAGLAFFKAEQSLENDIHQMRVNNILNEAAIREATISAARDKFNKGASQFGESSEDVLTQRIEELRNAYADSKKTKRAKKDPVVKESDLKRLQTQLDLEDELFGKTKARQRVIQALSKVFVDKNPEIVSGLEAQIVANQKLIDQEQQRQSLIDSVTGSIENGMMAMVDGTLSVKDAFKSMASDIIKELYRILVVQKIVAAAKTAIMGFAEGGVISGGTQVTAYANGGIVGSPTTFPMSGGKTGLMGEDGPEAIMPLKRGANGKLGVQMEGGKGGDNIVIHQNFNFQANGDDTVKKLIAQAAPKIMSMTKTSLIEDRRRGGSTKAAFG